MKKKLLLLTLCLCTTLISTAQTQHGIVKTPGRLASNGKVIAGKRIAGATVQVKGRTAVKTAADGTFSFPVPGNSFLIQSVKKQGYILVDPEAITRQYTYSSNPITFALVIPTEQADDKLAKERQIRNTLEKKLHAREDEIEGLKAQNKISQEDYRKELQRLYTEQENNEKLIKNMAERYTQIDFDQMDEFNLRISDCILNGRLTEADSLLRTKGDINTRIEKLNKQHEANVETRDNLEKSEAMEQKDREDIAQDCLHYFETFLMSHKNDSATHYIQLLAKIDTLNVKWKNIAGFFQDYSENYLLALDNYQHGLEQAIIQYGEQSVEVAVFYQNIGKALYHQCEYQEALVYCNKAINIYKQLPGKEYYSRDSYDIIGDIYDDLGDFTHALENRLIALNFREKMLGKEHTETATSYNDIAVTYEHLGDFNNALEYFFKELAIDEKSTGKEHPSTATTYNNIGYIYSEQGNYDKALEYYFKALNIYKNMSNNLSAAKSYALIGDTYNNLGDYDNALEMLFNALNISERELGQDHLDVALLYNNIGSVYFHQGNYNNALEYCLNALKIQEKLLGDNNIHLAIYYDNIGLIYSSLNDFDMALEYDFKALKFFEDALGNEHPNVSLSYYNIGMNYYNKEDYFNSLKYLNKSLEINEKLLGTDNTKVKMAKKKIVSIEYLLAVSSNCLKSFLSDHCFTATVADETPAQQQGMTGEYVMLEYNDWQEYSPVSLFDKNAEFKGKPKDIVVLKDGVISKHHFEDKIGVQLGVKEITHEERERINQLYEIWKRENK